jgi:hypothetical protein
LINPNFWPKDFYCSFVKYNNNEKKKKKKDDDEEEEEEEEKGLRSAECKLGH